MDNNLFLSSYKSVFDNNGIIVLEIDIENDSFQLLSPFTGKQLGLSQYGNLKDISTRVFSVSINEFLKEGCSFYRLYNIFYHTDLQYTTICLPQNANKKLMFISLSETASEFNNILPIESALKKFCIYFSYVNIRTGKYHLEITGKNAPFFDTPCWGNHNIEMARIANNFIVPEDKEIFLRSTTVENIVSTINRNNKPFSLDYRVLDNNQNYIWKSMNAITFYDDKHNENMLLIVGQNIPPQKLSKSIASEYNLLKQAQYYQNELQKNSDRYKTLVEQTDTVVFEWTRDNNIEYLSPNFGDHFNIDILGKTIYLKDIVSIVHSDDSTMLIELLKECKIPFEKAKTTSIRLKTKDNVYLWFKIAVNCFFKNGHICRIIGTLQNINSSVETSKALHYKSECDTLTGIRNSEKFFKDINEHLRLLSHYTLIMFDVDKFKVINDINGIAVGNKILCYIADILSSLLKDTAIYARLYADSFGIFLSHDNDENTISVINTIISCVNTNPYGYTVSLSFGIYKNFDKRENINIACDRANLAKKTIKGNVLQNYAFYNEGLSSKLNSEKEIEDEMYDALAEKQFKMYLQPKYDIQTNRVVGAEALVRWIHPRKGIIAPYCFIDIFEQNGFIKKLDEYMWEEACKRIRRWIDIGVEPVPISVNVSRLHINNENLIDIINGTLEKYNIPKNLIELEITETLFFEEQEQLTKKLFMLKDAGYVLEMDDFGSGYSSLNMLKNTPFDVIKIDREFFNKVMETEKGQIIIHYTIEMALKLNLKIVAEGVETKEQADFLLDCGCNIAQGYYYSKPVPAEDFEKQAFVLNN